MDEQFPLATLLTREGILLYLRAMDRHEMECSIAGCGRRITAKGFCQVHYLRQRAGWPSCVVSLPVGSGKKRRIAQLSRHWNGSCDCLPDVPDIEYVVSPESPIKDQICRQALACLRAAMVV